MSVRLSYDFQPASSDERPGGEAVQLGNPVFRILAAIRRQGSIGRAADELGLSYRHVWGVLKEREQVYGKPLILADPGQAARLSPFGEGLLWAERRTLARLMPAAEAMAARLDHDLLLAARPELVPVSVCASHDLLFAPFRQQLRQDAGLLLDVDFCGSAEALERLNAGLCDFAGVHMAVADEYLCRRGSRVHQALGRQLRLGDHKLIRLAHRQQGLMVAPGNPLDIAGLGDLGRPGLRFINRAPGSGTRLMVDELVARHGLLGADIAGYARGEPTHLAVAACVAAGLGDCGFGLEGAAARMELGFIPLVAEQYFIVCRKPRLEGAVMEALMAALASPSFRHQVDGLPGYSSAGSGEIISLRRTLPWYK